jgi:hypothetical protein
MFLNSARNHDHSINIGQVECVQRVKHKELTLVKGMAILVFTLTPAQWGIVLEQAVAIMAI